MTPETLRAVLAARAEGNTVTLATRIADGVQFVLPDAGAPAELNLHAGALVASDDSAKIDVGGEAWFLQVEAPPARLLIVGAVHVTQSLAPMAAMCGYAPTIIDPRRGFATGERFPGLALIREWPDEALASLAPDDRTAIVTLTHDQKIDDPALDSALRARNFFIGALGSRKTHAARLERLAALGHAPDALARIRGPVGLAIGARTAPEIALSILAEITAARRNSALGKRS
jgi:xanthine dehydrogenase accessory factor